MAKRAGKKRGVQGAVAEPAASGAGRKATRGSKAKASGSGRRKGGAGRAAPVPVVALTHDQIAERAYQIWQGSGSVPGREQQDWAEAEAQLKREHGLG